MDAGILRALDAMGSGLVARSHSDSASQRSRPGNENNAQSASPMDQVAHVLEEVYQHRFADDDGESRRNLDAYRDLDYAGMLAADLRETGVHVRAVIDLALDDLADVWGHALEGEEGVVAALAALVTQWQRAADSVEASDRDALVLRTAAGVLADVADDLMADLVLESVRARASRDHLYDLAVGFHDAKKNGAARAFLDARGVTAAVSALEAGDVDALLDALVDGVSGEDG